MLDLDEQIRQFVDGGAPPVTAQEVVDAVGPRRVVRRSPAWRRPRWAAYAVGTAALVASAVVVALAGTSSIGPPPATRIGRVAAPVVLRRAAAAADAQSPVVPGPGQFLYVRTLTVSPEGIDLGAGQPSIHYYVDAVQQSWTSPTGPGTGSWAAVGQPTFVTGEDRSAWEAAGSPPISSGLVTQSAGPYYDVVDLPTDPSQMSAYFASQTYLATEPRPGHAGAWEFDTAADFLQAGASSAQRAALLEFMATIPGVANAGAATSLGTKQTGTLLTIPAANNPGMDVEVIVDPTTSELIEQRTVVTDAAKNAEKPTSPPLGAGEATWYRDFLYAGIANSSNVAPAAAPPLTTPWPYGTTRTPAPGSAYP